MTYLQKAQVFLHWCLRNSSSEPLQVLALTRASGWAWAKRLLCSLLPLCLQKAKDAKEHFMVRPKQTAVSSLLFQVLLGQWGQWVSLRYRFPGHQPHSDDLHLTKRSKALNFCPNKTNINHCHRPSRPMGSEVLLCLELQTWNQSCQSHVENRQTEAPAPMEGNMGGSGTGTVLLTWHLVWSPFPASPRRGGTASPALNQLCALLPQSPPSCPN